MSNFTEAHLRLVEKLNDVKTDGTAITAASQDGKIRTSVQRSKDLMAGRYFVNNLFRIAAKRLYYVNKSITVTSGYADITALGITTPADMVLSETSGYYNKTVPIYDGDELPFFEEALRSYKSRDIVAGIIGDGSQSTTTMRLRVILGSDLAIQVTASYTFVLGYYENVKLTELVAASVTDLTEPRPWWDCLETYAEFMAWQGSGNFQRAQAARKHAFDLAMVLIKNEHGDEALAKVQKYLQVQG